ncbi:MAG: FHA domain-containing protein [Eubacterium sp.]|nr:FHA domain-containing protein [Eubacterium sp.]
MGGISIFNSILSYILYVGLGVLSYVIMSYIVMFQGRKAGLNNDWFAYIPIVRTVYRLDMVGEARWKCIFIGGLAAIIKSLLLVLLIITMVNGSTFGAIIFDILLIVFMAACAYIEYNFDRKLYRLFGFNEHLALIGMAAALASMFIVICIPSLFALLGDVLSYSALDYIFDGGVGDVAMTAVGSTMSVVILYVGVPTTASIISLDTVFTNIFNFITAFDNRCQANSVIANNNAAVVGSPAPSAAPNAGQLVCTAGMYKDAAFSVENNFEIILGRDSYFASIVINENAAAISRKHCGVRYNSATGDYTVTDYSSNGTYVADTGERLPKNTPKTLSRGTSIYLGDKMNRFKLM